MLETSVAPVTPAELSFVSADGGAVTTPALVLEYCDD
jgi:hypothetical protein